MLRLALRTETTLPIEVEGILPTITRELSRAAIEKLPVLHGNQSLPLAELFSVTGDSTDERIEWSGDLSGVHWLGAKMSSGTMICDGPIGRHLGSQMTAGLLQVAGNASDWAGAEMRGGRIEVGGNAGDRVGSAYHGSARGMSGGIILVRGNAGDEVGATLRRGLICIVGNVGALTGVNLRAGTVMTFGKCGPRPGAGMRRGTLALLSPQTPSLLPTFRYACRYRPSMLGILFRLLKSIGLAIPDWARSTDLLRYSGDLLEGGRGEVLVPAAAIAN